MCIFVLFPEPHGKWLPIRTHLRSIVNVVMSDLNIGERYWLFIQHFSKELANSVTDLFVCEQLFNALSNVRLKRDQTFSRLTELTSHSFYFFYSVNGLPRWQYSICGVLHSTIFLTGEKWKVGDGEWDFFQRLLIDDSWWLIWRSLLGHIARRLCLPACGAFSVVIKRFRKIN